MSKHEQGMVPPPSEEEIELRCYAIRMGWSRKVERDRAPHLFAPRWTVPEVSVEFGRRLLEDDGDRPME